MAGSLRRLADSVKDLDIIATAEDPAALAAALAELPLIESVLSAGDAGARVLTHSGMKVDLKVVEPDQFGNVLQHFTGSKAHNVALRESAVRRGLHVSEYGILDDETGETLRCATEEEVYERLGLAWIPPELREGRGELEAAAAGDGSPGLPRLLTQEDIRGDLHCHTTLSDGRHTLEQMAEGAIARGLEYLAVTDHSASHGFGDHVTPEALEARIEEVHALNAQLDGLELLTGTEVNILTDGSVDYEDELLARLDWVIASVHTSFSMGEREMTDRMVAAIEHPLVDAIGHPTGRKIETRPPYALDMERVIEAAARTGHDDRDQLVARPPRPQRAARARGGAGRGEDPRQHRRALDAQLRAPALRDRHGAAGVADAGAGGKHAPVGRVRAPAQARALTAPAGHLGGAAGADGIGAARAASCSATRSNSAMSRRSASSVTHGSSGLIAISAGSQRGQTTMRLRRSIPRTTASAASLTG